MVSCIQTLSYLNPSLHHAYNLVFGIWHTSIFYMVTRVFGKTAIRLNWSCLGNHFHRLRLWFLEWTDKCIFYAQLDFCYTNVITTHNTFYPFIILQFTPPLLKLKSIFRTRNGKHFLCLIALYRLTKYLMFY